MNKKQRIVKGQTASNISYSTLVLNFDVCWASSTNYDQKEKKSIFASSQIFHGWFNPFSSAVNDLRQVFKQRTSHLRNLMHEF